MHRWRMLSEANVSIRFFAICNIQSLFIFTFNMKQCNNIINHANIQFCSSNIAMRYRSLRLSCKRHLAGENAKITLPLLYMEVALTAENTIFKGVF